MIKNLLLISTLLLCMLTLNAQTTILDFETPATTTTFEYFGSSNPGGLMDLTVANPDASGINTSANVAEFTKPAGSEVWAGAYGDVPTLMDFTTNNTICVKVWVSEPTNLNLKVENGDASLNWELAKQVDVTETWVEVCYNTTGQIAEGQVYNRLVLFFDFGAVLGAEKTYYFDDVVTTTAAAELYDLTFSVDMNNYTEPYDSVFVSGTFNGFSTNSNPLEDTDGDGIWTHTIIDMAPGDYEYLFQLDKFDVLEDFSDKYYDCTNTTFGAGGEVFVNRTLSVNANATLSTPCFNSCYDCGGAVTLKVYLGEGNATPSDEGFYIAGGGNFGNPGQFLLTDNGNGIHSGSFEKILGFTSFYTFTNGACGDFSCKENIAGQDCSNPGNFDDREMGPLNEDTTIRACFESCSNTLMDGTNCLAALPIELLSFTGRDVNGINKLAWRTATEKNSDFFEIQKSADGVNFSRIGTVDAAGTSLQVRSYTFNDNAPFIGNNYYRLRMVDTDGTFDYSNVVQINTRIKGDIVVYPVPVKDALYLAYDSDNTGAIEIQIVNAVGQIVFTYEEKTTQGLNTFELNTKQLTAGAYLIHIMDDKGLSKVKRFVKN